MAVDVSKLDRMDRIVVITAAIALVSLFLPWYGYSSGAFSASVSGFSTGYGWLGALLIIAAGVYLLLLRSGSQMPKTKMGPGVLVLGASAIGTFLVIIRWITVPKGSGGIGGITNYSYGPRIGMYFALIAGVVQVFISFKLFKQTGESMPWENKAS
ncbi:MAG: hypothetical protein ACRDV0_00200 [Acidimicrobiales bacterium]